MKREILEKNIIDNLNRNFSNLSMYFDFRLNVFNELENLIFEINKCLVLEFYRAAITLTNHLLERLLKLALINNETGIGPIPTEQWNSTFEGPNQKYSSINLGNSIEKCKKFNLISEEEWKILNHNIRELMRNGFSHADSTKILADLPDESVAFQGNLNNPSDEIKKINLNQKVIPFLQELNMENFAKESAIIYFDFVFKLIFQIENRLIENNK